MRARTGSTVLAAATAVAVYARYVRPWQLTWGATPSEVARPLPGDELAGLDPNLPGRGPGTTPAPCGGSGSVAIDGILFGIIYAKTHNLKLTWATHYAADVVGIIAIDRSSIGSSAMTQAPCSWRTT